MHLAVPHPASTLAAGGIDYDFAAYLSGTGLEAQGASLQRKCSVYGMEHVAEGEVDSGLVHVERQVEILSGGCPEKTKHRHRT